MLPEKIKKPPRLSAYRRAQLPLKYCPPPPQTEAEALRERFGSLKRVARMILLHKIFSGS